jgi:DNA topoisomerase-1
MGEIVTDRLEANFRELMNYDFTAQMEDSLDQVASHQAEWKKEQLLQRLYQSA